MIKNNRFTLLIIGAIASLGFFGAAIYMATNNIPQYGWFIVIGLVIANGVREEL